MKILRLESGFFRIERDDKVFFGLAVGSSRARVSSGLAGLKGSVGRIFSPDNPNTQETWNVTGHMAYEDVMIVYGPWIEVEGSLEQLSKLPPQDALNLVQKLSSSFEHMPGEKELFAKGLLISAYLRLKDGRVLMLPHQVQDLVLSLEQTNRRFLIFDAYHHPSLKGESAYRFGLAVLAYQIACGTLPWSTEGGPIEYTHRVLAGNVSGPGSYLETSTSELEQLAKKILSDKDGKTNESDLQIFMKALISASQGLGDKSIAAGAKLQRPRLEKKYRNQSYWKRNGVRVAIIAVVVLLVSIIPASIISKQLRDPRTLGLLPQDVVKAFYRGFNELDTELMEDAVAKGVGSRTIDTATNFYVVDRIRTATEARQTRMTPEEWIKLGKPVLAFGINVFGIADLKIDEKQDLRSASSRVYDVEYDFYFPGQNQGDQSHSVVEEEHRHEQARVTQNKDRKNLWQITELKTLP